MQLACRFDPNPAHVSRLVIAGLAVVGAALFAANAATPTAPQVQHRAVRLAATEVDWSTVIADAEANLAMLQSDAAGASSDLSTALGNVSSAFGTQISTALTADAVESSVPIPSPGCSNL